MYFELDVCYDYSFWQAETGRCIPKDIADNLGFYTWPPLCNRTLFSCEGQGHFNLYCPNSSDHETCMLHEEDENFFCEESKTCISRGKCTYKTYDMLPKGQANKFHANMIENHNFREDM